MYGLKGLELIGWKPGDEILSDDQLSAMYTMAQIYSGKHPDYRQATVYWDAVWTVLSSDDYPDRESTENVYYQVHVPYERATAYHQIGDDETARAILEYALNTAFYRDLYEQLRVHGQPTLTEHEIYFYFEQMKSMYRTY